MVGSKIANVITSPNAFGEFEETSWTLKGDSRNFILIPASIGPRRRLLEFSPQARPSTSGVARMEEARGWGKKWLSYTVRIRQLGHFISLRFSGCIEGWMATEN